jgi:DNA-binding transcriptional regulator YiaG
MPRHIRPSRDQINANRKRLHERAEAGALRYPFAILEIRKTFGMTQVQFADLLKMTRRQVAEMERDEGNPTLESLNRVAKIFGFTVGFVPRWERYEEPASAFQAPMASKKGLG